MRQIKWGTIMWNIVSCWIYMIYSTNLIKTKFGNMSTNKSAHRQMSMKTATACNQAPIKSNAQICAKNLVPALVSCAIFLLEFSADLVVAVQHFREQNPIWGGCTILFMYMPALAYFLFTVSRPDWWITDSELTGRGIITWFLLQVFKLIFFPFFALYRYATQIVLSVDAMLLCGNERQKTLNEAASPAAIELLFFLQAWFQAIPQALFQSHLFFREHVLYQTYQSKIVQAFCVLLSIIVVAKTTTSFQRYESQRLSGRKLPWAMWYKKYNSQELTNLEEKEPLHAENSTSKIVTDKTMEQKSLDNKDFEDRKVILERQQSVTPPLPPKNVKIVAPPTPLRRITSITPLSVPDMPAPPRPDAIIINKDRLEGEMARYTNSEAAEKLNKTTDISSTSLRLPKRTLPSQGLEEDDTVGAILAFCWWFLFIVARILSIVTFFEFFPYYSMAVIAIHYFAMLTYLFTQSKFLDLTNIFVILWLGIIYIFSVIEYRIKFKHADTWILMYYTFVILQNLTMCTSWYLLIEWNNIWLEFIFYGIIITMILCVITTAVYFSMLKPKKRRIYVT